MSPYTVRQLDAQGDVVREAQVEASSTDEALRQLKDVVDTAQRIEVYDVNDERVRQIGVAYWCQKWRRPRR